MRVLSLLRNSAWSLASYAVMGAGLILLRGAFTRYLPVELLGLEGLFGNIVALLSFAEMGVGVVVSYGLYREIARGDRDEINLMMNVYRRLYLVIGGFVTLVGAILFFFLPQIVRDPGVDGAYVRLVYCIQIATALSTYFLAYRRTLFAADRKEYICLRIDLVCNIIATGVKFAAIVFWQSYVVYALTALVFNILANAIISRRLSKAYPFLHSVRVTLRDIRERGFFADMKNYMIHHAASTVYHATDAIVIASELGLRMAGLVSNYTLITEGVYRCIYRLFRGVIPAVADVVYTEGGERAYQVFRTLDFIYYLLGGYMACLYIVALQPFMMLFFGAAFLLEEAYVLALAVHVYIGVSFENAYNFRNTHGRYENDRAYMVASAIVNLGLSIVMARYIGITGVVIGTIAGLGFIVYGRVQFVFRLLLRREMRAYWLTCVWRSAIVAAEIWLIDTICRAAAFPASYPGLAAQCAAATCLMGLMQYAVFRRHAEMRDMLSYGSALRQKFKEKIKGSSQ